LAIVTIARKESKVRIIGGTAKRRGLKSPSPSSGVRPILARIKKSLFDILRPRWKGRNFLDLYAGSGAVGLEALSRGAALRDVCRYESELSEHHPPKLVEIAAFRPRPARASGRF